MISRVHLHLLPEAAAPMLSEQADSLAAILIVDWPNDQVRRSHPMHL